MTQFRRVLEALDAEGVRYVVIGGAALTEDIDIVYARDENNIERLVTVLGKIHPRLRVEGEPDGLPFIVDARTISNGGTSQLLLDGLIIAKRAANRPKDLVVLPEIESLRELRELDREL